MILLLFNFTEKRYQPKHFYGGQLFDQEEQDGGDRDRVKSEPVDGQLGLGYG